MIWPKMSVVPRAKSLALLEKVLVLSLTISCWKTYCIYLNMSPIANIFVINEHDLIEFEI